MLCPQQNCLSSYFFNNVTRTVLMYWRSTMCVLSALKCVGGFRQTAVSLPILTYLLHGAESFLRSWPVFAANQELPRILWNPKDLYSTHKSPPPVPILSQLTVPSLSYLTSCTPTKSNLYLANSLAAAVSEPALYRLHTTSLLKPLAY
jgi:hypothetical protein